MRRQRMLAVVICAMLLCGMAWGAGVMRLPAGASTAPAISPAERTTALQSVLNTTRLSAAIKSAALNDFARLPVEAQDTLLARLSPTYASRLQLPGSFANLKIKDRIDLLTTPSITALSPASDAAGNWVIVSGNVLTPECKVKFDGTEEATTLYTLDYLLFKVPNKPVGTSLRVTVVNPVKNTISNAVPFKVIANRGYRGVNGWQFINFGSPDLSWNIYRDYFTPAAVEYGNGTHREAAQLWYDASYKHIAHGGDCYGMSLRSIRTRLLDYSGPSAAWWPGNVQPMVWNYPWTDPQIADCIREDQSGQLCAQAAALINDRYNHQTHTDAATFMWNAIASSDPARLPVMCMWYNGYYGHAVVGYQMAWDGVKYTISLYDNNKPYVENEANDKGSAAYINGNSFSYAYGGGTTANHMVAFSYNELVYSPPLLPTDAGGPTSGLAAECTIVAVQSQSAVQQITDENGRTLVANGQENTNQATRIPDSMRFIPLTGAAWPADAPIFFIFNHSTGKSLTFDINGNAAGAVRIFSPRSVTALTLQRGRLTLRNILQPAQELNLDNPNQMGLQDVQMLNVQPDRSERIFQLQNFQNLGMGTLKLSLSPAADALLASGIPAQCNLTIRRLSNAGARTAAMPNLTLQAGRINAVTVPDFNTLQNGTPRIELR